jgi:tRNA (adenine57-N1/adenine58-N1)-methyltransferase
MTHPRQRLQSHTSYLTFARLVPTPEGWERTLEERKAKKKSVSADVLERAAEFLKRRRKEGEHARERGQQQQQKSRARANAYANADEYSD